MWNKIKNKSCDLFGNKSNILKKDLSIIMQHLLKRKFKFLVCKSKSKNIKLKKPKPKILNKLNILRFLIQEKVRFARHIEFELA